MYAVKIHGKIKSYDPITSQQIPAFSMILSNRYTKREDAERSITRIKDTKVGNGLAEIVVVDA